MELVRNIFRLVGRNINGFRDGVSLSKTADGATTLIASAVADRRVIIVVKITETFADGTGAKPTFEIGQTGTTNKFAATTEFASGVLGDLMVFVGTLSGSAALLITAAAGTGTATGAIGVEAIILPATA